MEEEVDFDLKDFFQVIKKRIKLIAIVTFVFVLIAGILSFFVIKPTYEAKVSMIIGRRESSQGKLQNNDVMMYQNLVKTYAVIAESDRVSEIAASKLGGKYTKKEIKKMIKVTPKQGTQILVIRSENKSPEEAVKVVDEISKAFVAESKVVYPTGGNVSIIDSAKVPDKPIKPKKLLNIAIAFFIGLMGSIGLVFLLEYMDRTLKTEEDIEKYLDIPVIGVIPKIQENK